MRIFTTEGEQSTWIGYFLNAAISIQNLRLTGSGFRDGVGSLLGRLLTAEVINVRRQVKGRNASGIFVQCPPGSSDIFVNKPDDIVFQRTNKRNVYLKAQARLSGYPFPTSVILCRRCRPDSLNSFWWVLRIPRVGAFMLSLNNGKRENCGFAEP
ncbi:hypothetical protein Bpfe_003433 [Biomphalaria pfeifferi]|uniref:Uncharacterized protein n=1 Tax=Biomphalaria pfeifferi TaxID=112525 RepID=A0AAD8C8G5_BIOPF|nr:hypothetical protein Bpfe_003433 [Biomphalaria pfeifferi]